MVRTSSPDRKQYAHPFGARRILGFLRLEIYSVTWGIFAFDAPFMIFQSAVDDAYHSREAPQERYLAHHFRR